MLIVQISDLHIPPPGQKTLGKAPMAENLALCIEQINQLSPKPDLVMVSGDITHDGTLVEAKHAANLLSNIQHPYYIIPGNHDSRETLWQVFGSKACPQNPQGFINFAIEGPQIRIIALDSVKSGESVGQICPTRADWLKARLAEGGDQPTAIFMHHPPCNFGIPETDLDRFEGADMLGQIIADHKNITGLYCGHIHLPAHRQWHGAVVSTAPSMGMQLTLDLTLKNPSQFVLEAPGYQLHYLAAGQQTVTHTVYVRETNGPHSF